MWDEAARQLTGVHAPPQRQPNVQDLARVVIVMVRSRQQHADGIRRRVEVAAAVSARPLEVAGWVWLVPPLGLRGFALRAVLPQRRGLDELLLLLLLLLVGSDGYWVMRMPERFGGDG